MEEQTEYEFGFMSGLRNKLHIIIFGTDTKAGRLFDIILLYAILISIIIVMLESVREISTHYNTELKFLEWTFTVLFTLEYLARILTSPKPSKYIFGFFGVIDLLSIIPTYLTIFIPGSQYLIVIRGIRLLRVFRVLKLTRYMGESKILGQALWSSRRKIIVFLGVVLSLVVISGTMMYVIEGAQNGFTSIPRSIYWAVVTITTVGYGDIAPQTVVGQFFAMVLMLTGYAIIAVPTGIVTSEITMLEKEASDRKRCTECKSENDRDATFCKRCGKKLITEPS